MAGTECNNKKDLLPDRPRSCSSTYQQALDALDIGICLFDGGQRVVFANRHYGQLYGLQPEQTRPGVSLAEIVQARVTNGLYGEGSPESYAVERLAPVVVASDRVQQLSDGRSILIRRRPLSVGGWVTFHEDVTERCAAEQQISHMAQHDALTGLPNRVMLQARLERALRRVRRGDRIAVHWLDLDRFKSINDTYGHAFGDALLKEVASRLKATVRETDLAARLGGDEFALIQVPAERPTDAAALASRVIAALSEPYDIDGTIVMIGVSIGVVLAAGIDCCPDRLMRSADYALYQAKRDGRGTYRFFESRMDEQMRRRRLLEADLRRAIVRDELELHFQPIVNLRQARVTCCEALVRWRHPDRGLVPPGDFVPLAEEIGLIVPIGEWVLTTACRVAASWPDHISVAVNVSTAQFKAGNLLGSITTALAASSLPPSRLEIEITESILIADAASALAVLHAIRQLGVRVSMDDFGTGYSSLSYLTQFPFDKLKIDRSFIRGLPDDGKSLPVLRSVAGIGYNLGMATTAEGVETLDQLAVVAQEGCTEVQGFYFSRPVPVRELADRIADCEVLAEHAHPSSVPTARRPLVLEAAQ